MTHQLSDRERSAIRDWLALPVQRRARLVVGGDDGAGKSAVLRETAAQVPGAALVDCTGLTADEVALRVCAALGVELSPGELRRGRLGLRGALRGDHTVFLVNSQWAGATLTSSEPRRIARALSPLLLRAPEARIRLALEWDGDRMGEPPTRDVVVTLGAGPQTRSADATGADGRHPLGVLAAAETAGVPVAVYRLLHEALGGSPGHADARALAAAFPDVLALQETGDDARGGGEPDAGELAFRSPSLARMWRAACPVSEEEQRRIVAALLAAVTDSGPARPWTGSGPVGRYAARALPAHAALAGTVGELLSDGRVLAQVRPEAAWDALAVAYPAGVPYGGVLAELRSLEAQGAWSLSQGEWAAWLHHAAVCAGRTELARQLSRSGVGMPFETVWTHRRGNGRFGPVPGEVGRIDELALVRSKDGLSLLTARDATTDRAADPAHTYVRQEFDSATGAPHGAPTVVPEPLYEAGWVYDDRVPEGVSGAFAERLDGEWEIEPEPSAPLPRCPLSVGQGIGLDDMWVLAGEGGLFAVVCRAGDEADGTAWHGAPLLEPHARLAAPEPPVEALAAAGGGAGTRAWLEEAFGAGACRRRAAGDLPDGITHAGTRDFLVDVGLPSLEGLLQLQTHGGLKSLPGDGTDGQQSGSRYEIGHWMNAPLALDGATGQVLRLPRNTAPEPAAGSLAQFFTMVRLFDTYRRGFHPSPADRRDAQQVLAAWCRRIDPTVDDSDTWDAVLGGHPFEDRTWELVTKDDRPPL
ncbi:SUKH-4 family immunity protein [Streptomyces sp. N2A]|uniref:SUKH-4 family immunity protein n=1 Tax=Streptomyces sp. N2A TaxID=3073936 RepID=UPI0028703D2B|nr:SUKH-4 family immunity protein [Streptomyces sp. N2A]